MLVDMIRHHRSFQDNMTIEQQEIYLRLADVFADESANLFKSPEELSTSLNIGNKFQWASFLSLEPVQQYIRAEISRSLQVMQRKTLLALQQEAKMGNVQAIKEIKDLSGIMAQGDTNKVIVLHQIARPKKAPVKQEEEAQE